MLPKLPLIKKTYKDWINNYILIYIYINKDEKIKKDKKDHPAKVKTYGLVLCLVSNRYMFDSRASV